MITITGNLSYDTTDPSKWSARDVFNVFASFDNSVFGHTKFIIGDGRLFGIDTVSGFVAELLTKFNKTTAKVSLMEPSDKVQMAVKTVRTPLDGEHPV